MKKLITWLFGEKKFDRGYFDYVYGVLIAHGRNAVEASISAKWIAQGNTIETALPIGRKDFEASKTV